MIARVTRNVAGGLWNAADLLTLFAHELELAADDVVAVGHRVLELGIVGQEALEGARRRLAEVAK